MTTNQITKETIIEILNDKDSKEGQHVSTIASKLVLMNDMNDLDIEDVKKRINAICLRESKKSSSQIVKSINPKTKRPKLGCYRIKLSRPQRLPLPVDNSFETTLSQPLIPEVDKADNQNLFVGKAGECAVMSELLFRGYNVNSMLVDDGVDIVASRNNMFYLIQVKTSHIKPNNQVVFTIRPERFETFMGYNIRYIVVARGSINSIETNIYFTFDNKDIQRYISEGLVSKTSSGINIKIRIDRTAGTPVLYHESKSADVKFYMNNFNL